MDVWQRGDLRAALSAHPSQGTHGRRRRCPRDACARRYVLPDAGRAVGAVCDASTLRPCENAYLRHEKRHACDVSRKSQVARPRFSESTTWRARPLRRTGGEMPGAWRVSWGAGLRRRRGHAQRTMVLEKGENVTMDVGIVLAHNHMPVALFPEQLLVRGLEPGIDMLRAVRSDGRIATRLDE